MPDISLINAINMALHHALQDDENVVVFGEDVGKNGGVFRATEGLQAKFGQQRVFDTPLAESLIAGLACGMSTAGLKPVAEFQFMGFIFPAFEQIVCHISRLRTRTQGRLSCPLVLRAPYAGGIHAPEHHSESMEALFLHIPGLRVLIPSTPNIAYHLLKQAIKHPDPVIFLEPKSIYHASKGPIDFDQDDVAIDRCHKVVDGDHITLISWGAMMPIAEQAISIVNQANISVELIDLTSIKPLDMESINNSVTKTGRCLILHEAPRSCGVAAEISARINESVWSALLAPIIRITGYDTVMPLAKLEKSYLPSVNDVALALKKLMEY
jgi:2-oxoisovalerate dehydrogenase E1 component beta subunit